MARFVYAVQTKFSTVSTGSKLALSDVLVYIWKTPLQKDYGGAQLYLRYLQCITTSLRRHPVSGNSKWPDTNCRISDIWPKHYQVHP